MVRFVRTPRGLARRLAAERGASSPAAARTSARMPAWRGRQEQTLPGSCRRGGRMWFNKELVGRMNYMTIGNVGDHAP